MQNQTFPSWYTPNLLEFLFQNQSEITIATFIGHFWTFRCYFNQINDKDGMTFDDFKSLIKSNRFPK